MFIMTKDEANFASHRWPANVEQPIDRDTQILLMTTAQQRHEESRKRIMQLFKDERKGS